MSAIPSPVRFSLHVLLAVLAACQFWACLGEEETPNGSEVENEITVGRLYLADGKPATGARVRVYPVNHLPQASALPKQADLVYSTVTDEKGRYRIDSLQAGEYNIFGDLEGERSLQDSVYLSASPRALPPDTLAETGSISGVVALQPNHDLRSATLQLLGTQEYVNADRQGRFTFAGLAAGKYKLRVTTTEAGYTALFVGVVARSGGSDTLADTLRPAFTGIPVVTGLRAEYDTAAGVATLSWHAADYPQLSRYQVFRDRIGSQILSTAPLDFTRDTVYRDTLFRGGLPVSGWAYPGVEYRVRIVSKSELPGLPYGSVELRPAAPAQVATTFAFELIGGVDGQVGLEDSLMVVARFANPTRKIRELRWTVGGGSQPLRTKLLDERVGSDTLRLRTPSADGVLQIRLEAEDEAGTTWSAVHAVPVVMPPVLGLRNTYDTASGVARLAWNPAGYTDISGYQIFRESPGSSEPSPIPFGFTKDTVYSDTLYRNGLPAPSWQAPGQPLTVRYRVRVMSRSGSLGLFSGPMTLEAASPALVKTTLSARAGTGVNEASIGDTLVLVASFGNPTRKSQELRWYLGQGATPVRAVPLDARSGKDTLRYAAPAMAGILSFRLEATDEAGRSWAGEENLAISVLADPPKALAGPDTSVYFKGSVINLHGRGEDRFGRVVKWEWDVGANGTFREAPGRDTSFLADSIPWAGIPCILRVTDDDGQTDVDTVVIRPSTSRFLSAMPNQMYDYSAVVHDGKIFLFGGVKGSAITSEVVAFDPVLETWTPKTPMPVPRRGTSAAVLNGKVHVIGGREVVSGSTRWAWNWGTYDLATDAWQPLPAAFSPIPEGYTPVFVSGGTMLAFISNGISTYSELQQSWGEPYYTKWNYYQYSGFADVQGRAFRFSVGSRGNNAPAKVYVETFDPKVLDFRDHWNFGVPGWDRWDTDLRRTAVIGSRVYLYANGILVSFDVLTNVDRVEPSPLIQRVDATLSAVNGKLYFIGGSDVNTKSLEPRIEEYIPLD